MLMRSLKSSVKIAGIRGLHVSGVAHLTAAALGVRGVVLAFHEIQDDLGRELWTGCPTFRFERLIQWLRRAGWEIVTLDEAVDRLHDPADPRRFAVITFDDGYRDIARALPILRREHAPFTAYVPTGGLTRDLFAWWLGLRELLRLNDKVEIPFLGRTIFCPGLHKKHAALTALTRWAHEDFTRVSHFSSLFAKYRISLESLCDRYFLSEKELWSLASEPLATIGAHTATHRALATLDDADVLRELVDNRAYLQDRLDREINHLAYPYGSPAACGAREARAACEAGFRTAVMTSHRPLFAPDGREPHRLPRINVHWDSSVAHLNTETGGLTCATMRYFLTAQAWSERNSREQDVANYPGTGIAA